MPPDVREFPYMRDREFPYIMRGNSRADKAVRRAYHLAIKFQLGGRLCVPVELVAQTWGFQVRGSFLKVL